MRYARILTFTKNKLFRTKTSNYTPSLKHNCANRYFSFVTTPIFYVNAQPHIGHLYSVLLADAHHRFQLMRTENKSFIFSSGTDEHGLKVEKAAASFGRSNQKHCDIVSGSFNRLCQEFNADCTHFIRTSEDKHIQSVSEFWKLLYAKGHIYKSHYEGWYCEAEETFLPESQITEKILEDKRVIKVSTETGHPVEWSSEENYMFNLEHFRPAIIDWIRTENPIQPTKFASIVIRWLEEINCNISVSRPISRFSWGIPVPGDPSQLIYVWLDALVNYLTVGGYTKPSFQWPPTVQVVGKDILKFHAIYWPAFLLAAGLELPRKIICHSHWTVDNVKMSKSLGNVVDPFELAGKYGTTGVRYFLLREGVPHSDGNFNEVKLMRMVNAELADTFGNLLSRCCSKAINPNQIWPEFNEDSFSKLVSPNGKVLRSSVEALPKKVESSYQDFNFYRSIEHIMATLRVANLFVEEVKPWVLVKSSPHEPSLVVMLSLVMEVLRVTGTLMWPIVPTLATVLLDRLNVPMEQRCWNQIQPFVWERSHSEKQLGRHQAVLFQRIKQ